MESPLFMRKLCAGTVVRDPLKDALRDLRVTLFCGHGPAVKAAVSNCHLSDGGWLETRFFGVPLDRVDDCCSVAHAPSIAKRRR